MNAQNMAKGMNDVHNLIDALVQQAAHEGWEDREVYRIDIIRMQNELREKYAALQQQLSAAREALIGLLDYVDCETCTHEETHRGGHIWTICDSCGRKWADDEGGFVPHQDAPAVAIARATIDSTLQRDRQP